MMFVFTDFQEDPGVKFESGWLFCGAILTTLLVNISTLVYQSLIKPLRKMRMKKFKLFKLEKLVSKKYQLLIKLYNLNKKMM